MWISINRHHVPVLTMHHGSSTDIIILLTEKTAFSYSNNSFFFDFFFFFFVCFLFVVVGFLFVFPVFFKNSFVVVVFSTIGVVSGHLPDVVTVILFGCVCDHRLPDLCVAWQFILLLRFRLCAVKTVCI